MRKYNKPYTEYVDVNLVGTILEDNPVLGGPSKYGITMFTNNESFFDEEEDDNDTFTKSESKLWDEE